MLAHEGERKPIFGIGKPVIPILSLVCIATLTFKSLENLDEACRFRIIPEFRIVKLVFHRKPALKH